MPLFGVEIHFRFRVLFPSSFLGPTITHGSVRRDGRRLTLGFGNEQAGSEGAHRRTKEDEKRMGGQSPLGGWEPNRRRADSEENKGAPQHSPAQAGPEVQKVSPYLGAYVLLPCPCLYPCPCSSSSTSSGAIDECEVPQEQAGGKAQGVGYLQGAAVALPLGLLLHQGQQPPLT